MAHSPVTPAAPRDRAIVHPPGLQIDQLNLQYGPQRVIENLTLTLPAGRITVLIGPNGSGKSTLLRAIARLLKPHGGTISLQGRDLHTYPSRTLARRLGILFQGPSAPDGLTVRELVARGRYPHQRWWQQWSIEDERQVSAALADTGLTALADVPLDHLSGGQRQRAWIAMALAQNTDTLLLDEPTTYLDLAHQIDILDLLWHLNRRLQRTIIMTLHDINQACRYGDWLVALRRGQVHASGEPAAIAQPPLIEQVFGMPCHVITDPVTGTPLCLPATRPGGR